MHREILNLVPGDGLIVDHINGDTLDNRKSNLRVVTAVENARNCKSWNKHGLKGIQVTQRGKWKAQIAASGVTYRLGTFDTKESAHEAYRQASVKYHGAFGRA